MPIYEYRCEDCGTKFEKLVRRSAGRAGDRMPVLRAEAPEAGAFHFCRPRQRSPKSAEMPVVPERPVQQSRHVRDEFQLTPPLRHVSTKARSMGQEPKTCVPRVRKSRQLRLRPKSAGTGLLMLPLEHLRS